MGSLNIIIWVVAHSSRWYWIARFSSRASLLACSLPIIEAVFHIISHNFINLGNISNIVRHFYGRTHMWCETTPYKRKSGKKMEISGDTCAVPRRAQLSSPPAPKRAKKGQKGSRAYRHTGIQAYRHTGIQAYEYSFIRSRSPPPHTHTTQCLLLERQGQQTTGVCTIPAVPAGDEIRSILD